MILPAMLTCIAFFCALAGGGLRAQDITHSFELGWPLYKVSNSLYNKITFLDSRSAGVPIGVITKGLGPAQVEKIVFKTPIEPQFAGLMHVLVDNTARDGELLFQLRRFRFVEKSGVRYCFLSASLYAKKEDRYFPLSHLNTVFSLPSRIWNTLQTKANTLLADFVAKGLVLPARDSLSYTFDEVARVDSIEKRSIPLYTVGTCKDGIYTSPQSFLAQRPEWPDLDVLTRKNGSIISVAARYSGGERRPVGKDAMYAIVYKGRPYMITEYGFYPLQRLGDDLYFTGELRIALTLGDESNSTRKATYQVMLNHQTGRYIFVRLIPPPNVNTGRPDAEDY